MNASRTRLQWLALLILLALTRFASAGESLQLEISGLSGELLDNVRASLSLEQARGKAQLTAGTIVDLHALAPGEITRALEPFGFYRVKIEEELQRPEAPDGEWRAVYRIDTGPPLPVGRLEIDLQGPGEEDARLQELVAALPLRQGAVLDHRVYEQAKRDLLAGVRAAGYLGATYELSRVEVSLKDLQATVQLRVATGPLHVFGAIEFEQDLFNPEYLARYLILETGTPFSAEKLAEQRHLLSRSGHFSEVSIQRQPLVGTEQPAVPLIITLTPFKSNRYRGRVGWGTDTGFGVQLDWTRRHVGRRGQHFTVGGAVVEERNKMAADLSYLIPLNPLTASHIELVARHESKDLTYEELELDEGGETRISTNLLSSYWHLPISSWGSFQMQRMVGVSAVAESYDIFEVLFGNLPRQIQDNFIESLGPEAYATLTPEFEALVPSMRLVLRRSDDRLFIRNGDFFKLVLLGADENLGSNIDFWQFRYNSWHIRPVTSASRVLLRTAVGYSDAESRTLFDINFNQMPEYYEFRAGGVRSVRGYGFETLFSGNSITGGKHQLVASIEYEHEIMPDISAAIFLDAGNAFNSFDDIDAKHGIGVGVRWRSPVGLARLDVGFPLDESDDILQIYITVGPEF